MTTIRIPEATVPDAWFAPDEYSNRAIARAVSAESGGRMSSPICCAESPLKPGDEDAGGFICTRAPGHKASRHIAVGTDVVAAWPGTHEPTLADLVEPTPPAIPDQPAEGGEIGTVKLRGQEYAADDPRVAAHVAMMRLLDEEMAARDALGAARSRTLLWFDRQLTQALGRAVEAEAERDRARDVAASLEAEWAGLRTWLVDKHNEAARRSTEGGPMAQHFGGVATGYMAAAMRMDEHPHGETNGGVEK